MRIVRNEIRLNRFLASSKLTEREKIKGILLDTESVVELFLVEFHTTCKQENTQHRKIHNNYVIKLN